MNNIKAFIFDMDGVILDSESICDRAWLMAGKEITFPGISEAVNQCRGCNKNDTIEILSEKYKLGEEGAKNFFSCANRYFTKIEMEEGIPLMPYAKEALEFVKKNYRLSLASSTPGEKVKRQLTNTGVFHLFETVTTGEMVTHSKPDPEIYLMAVKSLGLKPEQCAAVEDSPNGIKSASAAGLYTIMVPDKIQPAEEIKAMCSKIYPSLKEMIEDLKN